MKAKSISIDIFLKIIGLTIAGFGVWEYFDTKRVAVEHAAKSQTLDYIAKANGEAHQQALQILFEFWIRNSDVVSIMERSGQTKGGFQAFFVNAIRGDPQGNQVVFAIRRIGRFYDELSVCFHTSVCDREFTINFFCRDAELFASTYDAIFLLIGGQSGDQTLGDGLKSLAKECDDAELVK